MVLQTETPAMQTRGAFCKRHFRIPVRPLKIQIVRRSVQQHLLQKLKRERDYSTGCKGTGCEAVGTGRGSQRVILSTCIGILRDA